MLEERHIPHHKISHHPVQTIEDVLEVIRVDPSRLVKTLVIRNKRDRKLIVAAVPGNRRLNWKKLAAAVKVDRREMDLIGREEIEEITGLEWGGIPPFGYGDGAIVVLDVRLFSQRSVYCSAGTPTTSIEISVATLLRLSGGKKADISR
jgi:Cys-tRNA(Pro)/Cys-tRNA(Cys) deacylase